MLGRHRKVHLPAGEAAAYHARVTGSPPFDTPVGRMGMLIDYDKTFPEAARDPGPGRRAEILPACRPGRPR